MKITVYTLPRCVQCNATYRSLDEKALAYDVVDLSVDELASLAESFKNRGFLQAPVVLVTDDSGAELAAWAGFRPDLIGAIAEGRLA